MRNGRGCGDGVVGWGRGFDESGYGKESCCFRGEGAVKEILEYMKTVLGHTKVKPASSDGEEEGR